MDKLSDTFRQPLDEKLAAARPLLEPSGYFRRIPLQPHELQDRITPTKDVIVLCHLGVARLDQAAWSLTMDGLVERSIRLQFFDLLGLPKTTITTVHQCAGNPMQPFEPTRRISNVRWTGARLSDVLQLCKPSSDAKYAWSYGADYGEFGGLYHDEYLKDLPLERANDDVLLAYELNGAALPAEHGFPVRLVVPGYYGTNSVKWLKRITLSDRRAPSHFTTQWYNDPVPDEPGVTIPVWSIAPESILVSPAPHEVFACGSSHQVWGWAWADCGVQGVDFSDDGGVTWTAAEVDHQLGRSWQRFATVWCPHNPGPVTLCSRAYDRNGIRQPETGRRNAIHSVEIRVTG